VLAPFAQPWSAVPGGTLLVNSGRAPVVINTPRSNYGLARRIFLVDQTDGRDCSGQPGTPLDVAGCAIFGTARACSPSGVRG
jgi:hypothetical protein